MLHSETQKILEVCIMRKTLEILISNFAQLVAIEDKVFRKDGHGLES